MSENEPARLFEDPSASEAVRGALEAARGDLPSDAELASLAARLAPLLGPGGGGAPDPSAGASAGGLAFKTAGAAVAVAVVSGAAWWIASPPERAPREPPAAVTVEPERAPPREEVPIPSGLDVPEDRVTEPSADEPPTQSPRRAAPRYEVDPEAELALIRDAQDALRSAPARALELAAEHRRRFGEGTLGQEREVVAIDALVRLGRAAAARARADRFHRRWPRSAHGRRVDILVGAPPR